MLFTWSTEDLCIVFSGWHITGTGSLIFSLLAIILLTAGYEAVREVSRRYDIFAKNAIEGRRDGDDLSSESSRSHSHKVGEELYAQQWESVDEVWSL
jgi:copper transporter 1